MALSDSEVYNDKTCSNTCLKSFETLKTQYDNLRIELNKSEFDLATYKRGLASVEEQLAFYKKNKVMFTDQIDVLKRDASFNESKIISLKMQIEKLKKDKENNLIKIDNYENATKSLDKLIGSQIPDNSRKGVGYNAVPPSPTGLFAPPSIDLSNSGLEEFKQPEFEGYGPKANKCVNVDATKEIWILESYPNSKKWWSKKANVIPRGLAWSKVTMFEKSDYEELFGPMSNLNVPLIASPKEMSHAWFKDSAEFIKGLDAQDGTFLQDDQCREKSMEHHNKMCGETEDGNFVHRVVGKICPKMNRMSVDDGDGVLDSQTKDVIKESSMLPTMSSNSLQAGNAVVFEFFAEFDALKKEVLLIKQRKDDEFYELTKRFSKLETSETFVKFKKLLTNDLCIENESRDCNQKKSDGGVSIEEKPNFSSHHNDSLSTKIENPSIDSVLVVPPKVDDPMLHTIKPKDDFDKADVDSYDDDYMSMFNDEEQPAKSSLNDLALHQEPDIIDVKDGIFEQQANADKGKTTVIQETVGVKVEEQPSLGREEDGYISEINSCSHKKKDNVKQNRRHCAAL
ncbi:hypothetical protein Tco_0806677 [Tanacetum coccineum]